MTSDEVPLMFQAQVEGRCQIQRVIPKEQRQQSHDWVDQWLKVCPAKIPPSSAPSQPVKTKPGQSVSTALMRPQNKALMRPQPQKEAKDAAEQIPKFGPGVKTKDYEISWRFVSNSGQDEGVIRPAIAAKGWPFYPGASMKGAFLRACDNEQQAKRYCGEKQCDRTTTPGILRFHGAYPVNTDWTKQLVDIIHSQQERQVIKEQVTRANAQISLYQPTLRFGISSSKKLEESEWKTIWRIWEKALAQGLGSRVSAGYGQFKLARDNQLLQVKLKGQGVASTLIDTTPEFRPNMFKAALRGHTLRLLGGFTDEATAQQLTKELWGGFAGSNGSVVGLLGVAFDYKAADLKPGVHDYKAMPVYELQSGVLSILCMHRNLPLKQRQELETLAESLIKFSMLLGGFGKSWRRVDHRLFFPSYLASKSKPMIGCHWEFLADSQSFYYPVNDLKDIRTFLTSLNNVIKSWVTPRAKLASQGAKNWREAWHKAQVWGRIAANSQDSHAVKWFHDNYSGSESIKATILTGQISQIGHIWHRMYPRYSPEEKGGIKSTNEYVELLTIFPDPSTSTQKFIKFLERESEFVKLWG
jgi:CRISPR-associated protein Cmr6